MKHASPRVGGFALLLALSAPLTPAFGITYSAATDFNIIANPRGAWSYGMYTGPSRGVGFTLFYNNFIDNSMMSWGNSARLMFNYSNTPVTFGSINLEPRQVVAQPGADGRPAVLRFTAPNSGQYAINAHFNARDFMHPIAGDVFVVVSGTTMWTTSLTTFGGPGAAYISTLTLNAGETVDFTVDDRGSGSDGDATAMSVIIRSGCVADFDDGNFSGQPDGGVGIEDLLYFLAFYDVGYTTVDIDDGSGTGTPDGGVGIEDLLYFLEHFNAGC